MDRIDASCHVAGGSAKFAGAIGGSGGAIQFRLPPRMRALEENGTITGYGARVDAGKIGSTCMR
jgi:hypothetical protein